MNLITIKQAKYLTNKSKEDEKFLEIVSRNIERASIRGNNYIDIEVSDEKDPFYVSVVNNFPGFKIDEIKSWKTDNDPFHGKSFKYTFRIWW